MQTQQAASTTHTAGQPVYTDADFDTVDYKEFELSERQYEEFKAHHRGKPLPQQTFTDELLQERGFKSWAEYCIKLKVYYWD